MIKMSPYNKFDDVPTVEFYAPWSLDDFNELLPPRQIDADDMMSLEYLVDRPMNAFEL